MNYIQRARDLINEIKESLAPKKLALDKMFGDDKSLEVEILSRDGAPFISVTYCGYYLPSPVVESPIEDFNEKLASLQEELTLADDYTFRIFDPCKKPEFAESHEAFLKEVERMGLEVSFRIKNEPDVICLKLQGWRSYPCTAIVRLGELFTKEETK